MIGQGRRLLLNGIHNHRHHHQGIDVSYVNLCSEAFVHVRIVLFRLDEPVEYGISVVGLSSAVSLPPHPLARMAGNSCAQCLSHVYDGRSRSHAMHCREEFEPSPFHSPLFLLLYDSIRPNHLALYRLLHCVGHDLDDDDHQQHQRDHDVQKSTAQHSGVWLDLLLLQSSTTDRYGDGFSSCSRGISNGPQLHPLRLRLLHM